jgi:hypothetical protein
MSKVVDLLILFNLSAASIALYAIESSNYLPQLGVLEGRPYFYIWPLITSYVASRFFYKRSSHTE